MPGSLLAVFIKQTHPRDAIWQSSCIVSFSMSTKSKSFQISPCVHNKFYCYQMRPVIISKWSQDKKRWKHDLFWKVRKIDHQLPKDRHTLTKSKTKTISLNKSEVEERDKEREKGKKWKNRKYGSDRWWVAGPALITHWKDRNETRSCFRDDSDDVIYIMMRCLSVTKNDHSPLPSWAPGAWSEPSARPCRP